MQILKNLNILGKFLFDIKLNMISSERFNSISKMKILLWVEYCISNDFKKFTEFNQKLKIFLCYQIQSYNKFLKNLLLCDNMAVFKNFTEELKIEKNMYNFL